MFNQGNMAGMMKKVQKMQADMKKMQDELKKKTVEVSVASMYGGKIEFRTGKINGPLLATVDVKSEGDAGVWKTLSVPTKKTKGKHDLYIVFKGEKELFDFDWWHFKQ